MDNQKEVNIYREREIVHGCQKETEKEPFPAPINEKERSFSFLRKLFVSAGIFRSPCKWPNCDRLTTVLEWGQTSGESSFMYLFITHSHTGSRTSQMEHKWVIEHHSSCSRTAVSFLFSLLFYDYCRLYVVFFFFYFDSINLYLFLQGQIL